MSGVWYKMEKKQQTKVVNRAYIVCSQDRRLHKRYVTSVRAWVLADARCSLSSSHFSIVRTYYTATQPAAAAAAAARPTPLWGGWHTAH